MSLDPERDSDPDEGAMEIESNRSSAAVEGAGPFAHVLFFNNHKSCEARQKLEDYIIKLCGSTSEAEVQQDLIGRTESGTDVIGSVTYYELFCVDSLGHPMQSTADGKEVELPLSMCVVYGQVYLEPFWMTPVDAQEEKRRRRMAIKCFNCGDDHHLDDCPLPKDMAKIFQERQQYKANLGPVGADTRYHLSSSSKQQSEFCPGQISDKLRRALHLAPDDYPPYIRRMAIHGYPPGYLLLEKENHLSLFEEPLADANPWTRRSLEIIYPGFNDKSHSGALDLNINPVTTATDTSKSKTTSLDEELGSSFDYEFEEYQLEGGEQIVEFKVKEKQTFTNISSEKCFSLDFPPGLVHLDRDSQSTPGQTWEAIKTLLATKKKSRQ